MEKISSSTICWRGKILSDHLGLTFQVVAYGRLTEVIFNFFACFYFCLILIFNLKLELGY